MAQKKKKLSKPKINKVPLAVQEAVLANCKSTTMSNGPGAGMGACQTFDMGSYVGDCSALGS